MGSRNSSVVRTPDWKVTGSNPCRSSGRIFFSGVNFLCWLLFWYLFHPHVTAVACKRSQSFYPKCRWQVTAIYICGYMHEVTWCMVVWGTQNMPRRQQFHVAPAILMAFAPSLALDPTFGIHSQKTLDTALTCHLLNLNWKPSSSHTVTVFPS